MATVVSPSNPGLVTSPNANTDNTLVFTSGIYGTDPMGAVTAYIEILTGTFKFNVGASSALSNTTYTVGAKLILTLRLSAKLLQFQSANVGETFRITI